MATIRCRLTLTATDTPDRWHVSAKVQFTGQGVSPNPSSMHTYMGIRDNQDTILFNVPNPNIEDYQVHLRYRLIDSVTGYRNNWHQDTIRHLNAITSI